MTNQKQQQETILESNATLNSGETKPQAPQQQDDAQTTANKQYPASAQQEQQETQPPPVKRYPTSPGFMTFRAQKIYLQHLEKGSARHVFVQAMDEDDFYSLEAPTDGPLFFWQLYNILGPDRIYNIVEAFYKRVWNDSDAKWFRKAFTNVTSFQHACWAQANMWQDCFGGGSQYHGADHRLRYHHGLVSQVMTRDSAIRWLHHMQLALDESDLTTNDAARVRPAIDEFIQTFMGKYASEFNFDASDLDYNNGLDVEKP